MSDSRGQVTVMVLGVALTAFAVAGLAVDGTRAFLLRRTLQNAADAAATAAAGEVNEEAYYASGGHEVMLDRDAARREVLRWLAQRGIQTLVSVQVGESVVSVVLRDKTPVTFLALIGVDSIPVAVEARASPISGPPPRSP